MPFTTSDLPAGQYTRIRFHVGLLPQLNNSDPAQYPPGHPLNPQVNGLHWSWMGGYVFLALEGKWLKPDGTQGGYSYHIATARNLMTVELPVKLDLSRDCDLTISLDIARIFDAANPI